VKYRYPYYGNESKEVGLPVDVTVYLPDEIGVRAKALPRGTLSQLFRNAVIDELERRDTVANALSDVREYEVDVEDAEGRVYTGRITGTRIADDGPFEVFLAEDERVLVYDADKLAYEVLDDPVTDLRSWLRSDAAYAEALHALGKKPVVDL
jgi:hypothetical protein